MATRYPKIKNKQIDFTSLTHDAQIVERTPTYLLTQHSLRSIYELCRPKSANCFEILYNSLIEENIDSKQFEILYNSLIEENIDSKQIDHFIVLPRDKPVMS